MRRLFLGMVTVSLLLGGCQSVPLKGGVTDQGEKVYLTAENEIPKSIEEFKRAQDLESEEGKISYLIYRVQKSKVPFIRNGSRFTSQEASEFLRWKLERPRWRPLVKTARDFAIIITKGSVQSGQPYHVILANEAHHDLSAIMINELDFLEAYAKNNGK